MVDAEYRHLLGEAAPAFPQKSSQTKTSYHTPADMQQYAALALQAYAEKQITVPDGYVYELERLGYSPPVHRYQPSTPSIGDLLPPPTRRPERCPMEDQLNTLLQEDDLLHQLLAALLLWVNSRDRVICMHVIEVLTTVRGILDGIESERTRSAELRLVDARIRGCLVSIVTELDLMKSGPFRHRSVVTTKRAMWTAMDLLVRTRAWANGDNRAQEGLNTESMFWEEFRKLDFILEHQFLPDSIFELQFELVMVGAMMSNDVSPGSAVSELQTVAAQQLQLPVDWCWKEFQALGYSGTPFFMNAGSFLFLVQLIRIAQAPEEIMPAELKAAALATARKLAGHVLACCERLNIRLPQHASIRTYLSSLGYLSSVPLKNDDYYLLEEKAVDIVFHASNLAQQVDAREREEKELAELVERATTNLVESRTADDVEPPHLQQARAFLGGKRVVLIGGNVQPERRQKLIDTFDLTSLDWIPASEYSHGTHASHRVEGKADVVLIAIRWMGHAHSALKDVARAAGVPVVYLPAGLSPLTVAWQVCLQSGRTVKHRSGALRA